MKKLDKNKKAFSIIVAIFMIGFLMVLTIGVFDLVLREMKDNKGNENYHKAYAGAEGAIELGLLEIKENSYSYDKHLLKNSSGSEVLSFNDTFNKRKDPQIYYEMGIKTDKIEGGIIGTGSESTVIIPLFWKDENNNGSIHKIGLGNIRTTSGINAENDIIWNIIGENSGVSGTGSFDKSENEIFLTNNNKSYLILFNTNTSENIYYDLIGENGHFSNPNGTIESHVIVGKYKQNISTQIDNTKFLKMLKYSLYSK